MPKDYCGYKTDLCIIPCLCCGCYYDNSSDSNHQFCSPCCWIFHNDKSIKKGNDHTTVRDKYCCCPLICSKLFINSMEATKKANGSVYKSRGIEEMSNEYCGYKTDLCIIPCLCCGCYNESGPENGGYRFCLPCLMCDVELTSEECCCMPEDGDCAKNCNKFYSPCCWILNNEEIKEEGDGYEIINKNKYCYCPFICMKKLLKSESIREKVDESVYYSKVQQVLEYTALKNNEVQLGGVIRQYMK